MYRTPNTPVGYAADLAMGYIDNQRLDQVRRIVNQHGCTWRYEFNARKSGVLVYGEDQTEHRCNKSVRDFRL